MNKKMHSKLKYKTSFVKPSSKGESVLTTEFLLQLIK